MGFQWYAIPNSPLCLNRKNCDNFGGFAKRHIGLCAYAGWCYQKEYWFCQEKWYFDFSLQPTKTMLVFNEVKPNS